MSSSHSVFMNAFLFGRTTAEAAIEYHPGPSGDMIGVPGLPTCEIAEHLDIDPPTFPVNVFTSWGEAVLTYSNVLAVEAIAVTNAELGEMRVNPHDLGNPVLTCEKFRISIITLPEEADAHSASYELRVEPIPFTRGVGAWRRGHVVLLRLDVRVLRNLPRASRKRKLADLNANVNTTSRSDHACDPARNRYVFRHALAISPTSLKFRVQADDPVHEILHNLCGDSAYAFSCELTPNPSPIRCYGPVTDLSPTLRQLDALDIISHGPDSLQCLMFDPRLAWQWTMEPGSSCVDHPLRYWDVNVADGCTDAQKSVVQTFAARLPHRLSHGDSLAQSSTSSDVKWKTLAPGSPVCATVQGPPGSGKSTTCVEVLKGVLSEVFAKFKTKISHHLEAQGARGNAMSESMKMSSEKQPRFLICAPTNDATDELMSRVVLDPHFLTEVSPFYTISRAVDHPHGEVGFSGTLSRFLKECAVVRLGRRSKDTRVAVQRKLIAEVLKSAGECVRGSRTAVTAEIERLNRVGQKIDARTEVLASLSARIADVEGARGRGEMDMMSVDGVQCHLDGDLVQALQGMRTELQLQEARKNAVLERHAELVRDHESIENVFQPFVSGDRHAQEQMVIANSVCVFATCDGAADESIQRAGVCFDIVLVDEAARATIPQFLVPVAAAQKLVASPGGQRHSFDLCVVGDPAQNAATVISEVREVREHLGKSFLERAKELSENDSTPNECWPPFRLILLDKQFRLHPTISAFPRAAFYSAKLLDGRPETYFSLPWHLPARMPSVPAGNWYEEGALGKLFGPLLLVDTAAKPDGNRTTRDDGGSGENPYGGNITVKAYPSSRGNIGEAVFVAKLLVFLCDLLSELRDSERVERWCELSGENRNRKPTVLVLTPYKLQARILGQVLQIEEPNAAANRQPEISSFVSLASRIRGGRHKCEQVDFIREQICQLNEFFKLDVSTIDSSIGREVDFTIVSRVAPEPKNGTGFLTCPKRLCVSLTRASSLLVVLGPCKKATDNVDTKWDEFCRHCRQNGFLWPVSSVETDIDAFLSLPGSAD